MTFQTIVRQGCGQHIFSQASTVPPRTLHLDRWQWPFAVLFGDAALSTRRMAAILYIRDKCVKKAFSVQMPQTFLESLNPSGYEDLAINGFKAYCVNRARKHWDILRFKLVLMHPWKLCFADCLPCVGRRCWTENQIVSSIEWVHTKSNPADALTRLDGSQRLNAWTLSSKTSGSAGVQRASSSYCPAATVGGSSGATNFENQ